MLSDEYRYKILKRLEVNPEISQRELAGELDISLGRVNYCIQALIEKGLVKANNFRNSKNKKECGDHNNTGDHLPGNMHERKTGIK